jgi:hypothetical protein
MVDKPTSDVAALVRLLQPKPGVGRGRHSKLYWWLFTHAEEVRPILEQGRPLWADVASHLPDTDDVLDGAEKRPTADRVRKAWGDVCKAKGWSLKPAEDTAAKKPVTPPPPPPDAPQAGTRTIQLRAGDGTTINLKK